jgi:hypothetical protein
MRKNSILFKFTFLTLGLLMTSACSPDIMHKVNLAKVDKDQVHTHDPLEKPPGFDQDLRSIKNSKRNNINKAEGDFDIADTSD